MSSYSSSLVFKKNISHQVWQHLVELWLTTATNVETQLFTQDTLSKLLKNDHKIYISQRINNFYLLTGANFNALLLKDKTVDTETYQVSVIFDRQTIINELINLGNQQEDEIAVIKCLRSKILAKLSRKSNVSLEFMVRAIKLLLESTEQTDNHRQLHDNATKVEQAQPGQEASHVFFPLNPNQHNLYFTTPMDKLLGDQLEQERIFEQTKLQISQEFTLSEIIQTTIDHSCSFFRIRSPTDFPIRRTPATKAS